MEMLTAEHMQAISDEKKLNKTALKSLLQTPFDTLNSDQMQKFKQRLDHFEFSLNRSRIINSMTSLLTVWGSSWLWAVVLPTPDFAEILLNYALYVGLAGLTLRSFSMNEFHEELEEIKQIYNWALKDGQENYMPSCNNEAALKNPDVQRMITFLAPLCEPEFMIAWDKLTENVSSQEWAVVRAARWGASWFSSPAPVEKSADAKLKALKLQVENGELKNNLIDGLKQSLEYFATNPYFRQMISETALQAAQQPLNKIKESLMPVVSSTYKMS